MHLPFSQVPMFDDYDVYSACYNEGEEELMMLPCHSNNVDDVLQEFVQRNEKVPDGTRKRKASLSHDVIDNPYIRGRLKPLRYWPTEDTESCSSGADSPPDYSSVVSFHDDPFQVLNPPIFASPISNIDDYYIDDGISRNFPGTYPVLPQDFMRMSWQDIGLATRWLDPPRPSTMEKPSNQQLFQAYLNVSAVRLGHTSPVYVDLFKKYIPAMAQESPALMESLLAIAALQTGMMRQDENIVNEIGGNHYQLSLALHGRNLTNPELCSTDAALATALIMTDYEFWSGENVKMGVHMLGCRDLILGRGQEAHMTPVGRALFATFRRYDIGSSAITGNPCFMTNDWWTVDPLTRIPIDDDSPPLLAADAALSKLTVICSKLTYVKAWATRKRRDLWLQSGSSTDIKYADKKKKLEGSISRKVARLQERMDGWQSELPEWFAPSNANIYTGNDKLEEDINTTNILSILPRSYEHFSIACVEAWAISIRLQLYRIKHPDVMQADPQIGGLVHALLRIFAYLPPTCDGLLMPCIFFAGMELRQKAHQEWFTNTLYIHMAQNAFPGFMFVLQGCKFAWMKLEGQKSGRFTSIKEGAAARIDGVSENLWSAEGVLGAFEALSLYDSADTAGQRKNFQGDVEGEPDEEDMELEDPGTTPKTTASISAGTPPNNPREPDNKQTNVVDLEQELNTTKSLNPVISPIQGNELKQAEEPEPSTQSQEFLASKTNNTQSSPLLLQTALDHTTLNIGQEGDSITTLIDKTTAEP